MRFVSDNAGRIAFDLPELFGTLTWFTVLGHGYEVPADGFGYRGVRLTPERGKTLTVKVKRTLPGKRLGRITGGGLFAESQKLGLELDWREPGILGCDSVQIALHQGRQYWAWGDTILPGYPLGLFHMLGATTKARPLSSFQPPVRLHYEYFRDSQDKPRVIGQMPGPGPTWINGVVSLPDAAGHEQLVGTYSKIEPPLSAYEVGLCVWNDEAAKFEPYKVLWKKSESDSQPPVCPEGHPAFWTDPETNQEWVLFGDPFPRLRCAKTFAAWADPAQWEQLQPQPTVPVLNSDETIKPHRGSIAWNAYRGCWVTVFTQMFGEPSLLGELWYAESERPTGPWEPAVKVVTHDNYTFYNPRLHADFTPEDSPILLFEATYTSTFANHAAPTPRHDYNQVLYRLDLDEPALQLKPAD